MSRAIGDLMQDHSGERHSDSRHLCRFQSDTFTEDSSRFSSEDRHSDSLQQI